MFAALGDELRLRLVARLCEQGPLSITKLADDVDVTRQAVTKHLDILEQASLIDRQLRGRERLHTLRADPLRLVSEWLGPYEAEWDARLARLRSHVEGDTDE